MLPKYSIVKARALDAAEMEAVMNSNVNYLAENYDTCGYRVFNAKEKDEYRDLARYMKPVTLYTNHLNFQNIRESLSLPPVCQIVDFSQNGNIGCFIFQNPDGTRFPRYLDRETAKNILVEQIFDEYYVAYVEPIYSFAPNIGSKLAARHNITHDDGSIKAGYFSISWIMAVNMTKEAPNVDPTIFKHNTGEEMLFYTVESPRLKTKEELFV